MNTIKSNPMWTMGMLARLSGMSLAADLSTRPVTFTKDVAPIFQARYKECLRKGTASFEDRMRSRSRSR